jgi:3-deoxy-D-manno-octulosonic-acid transferase
LLWRSIKAPSYRHRWYERFSIYNTKFPIGVVWFHAVSVGEAEALFPLLKQIKLKHPDTKLLITTTTPTGSARVKAVMQDTVSHVYLPYDVPDAICRFMSCFKPRMAVMMETEIWPNIFNYCGDHHIPLYIINARLSEKSSKRYQKISRLIHPALANIKCIATQTKDDASRFISIGADSEKVETLGNIKFDVEITTSTITEGLTIKADLFMDRFVWLIASTHKDEEKIFLDIYKVLKEKIPELLLILVPRHPERFPVVKKLIEKEHLSVATRTLLETVNTKTDVYLVDKMGELKAMYAAADVAFIGGSMVAKGGHNILEASAVGVPVMFGPFMDNFKEIARVVLIESAAIQCQSKSDIISSMKLLYEQPDYRKELARKGKAFVQKNQGAIDTICAMLEQHF